MITQQYSCPKRPWTTPADYFHVIFFHSFRSLSLQIMKWISTVSGPARCGLLPGAALTLSLLLLLPPPPGLMRGPRCSRGGGGGAAACAGPVCGEGTGLRPRRGPEGGGCRRGRRPGLARAAVGRGGGQGPLCASLTPNPAPPSWEKHEYRRGAASEDSRA